MDAASFNQLAAPCENIIFDYGGVFVDVVYQDAIDNLQKLTSKVDVSDIYTKRGQIKVFDQLETGKIGSLEFINELRKILKIENATDLEIELAWRSMLKGIHPLRVRFLKEIKKRKRVFVLSNINAIHEKHLEELIAQNIEIKDFYSHFEKVYFSHKIGLRKPNKEAYGRVLEENGLKPENTLFIDDSPQHVEGARLLGLKAVLLAPANTFIASFDEAN